jgi:hypothetical protein
MPFAGNDHSRSRLDGAHCGFCGADACRSAVRKRQPQPVLLPQLEHV